MGKIDQYMVTFFLRHRFNPVNGQRKKTVSNLWYYHANGLAFSFAQAACIRVGDVVQFTHHIDHPFFGSRTDFVAIFQCFGNCPGREAEGLGKRFYRYIIHGPQSV